MSRLLLLLAAVILLAGCGDDSQSARTTPTNQEPTPTSTPIGPPQTTTTTAPAPAAGTTAAWRTQVNAICEQNERATLKLVSEVRDSGLKGEAAGRAYIKKAVAAERPFLARLRKVPAPADLRADYARFLDRIGGALPLLAKLGDPSVDQKALNDQFKDIADDTRPFAIRQNIKKCLADGGFAGP